MNNYIKKTTVLIITTMACSNMALADDYKFFAYDSRKNNTGKCLESSGTSLAIKPCQTGNANQLFSFDNSKPAQITQNGKCTAVLSAANWEIGGTVGLRECGRTDTIDVTWKWDFNDLNKLVATNSPQASRCLTSGGPARLFRVQTADCSKPETLVIWDVVGSQQ